METRFKWQPSIINVIGQGQRVKGQRVVKWRWGHRSLFFSFFFICSNNKRKKGKKGRTVINTNKSKQIDRWWPWNADDLVSPQLLRDLVWPCHVCETWRYSTPKRLINDRPNSSFDWIDSFDLIRFDWSCNVDRQWVMQSSASHASRLMVLW